MILDFGKYRRGLSLFFKVLLGVLAFGIIVYMIHERAGKDCKNFLLLLHGPKIYIILAMVGLMSPINLLLEAIKWKFLIRKVEPLSLLNACVSILAGWNLALFTPARLGEFGGRILFLKSENRKKGALCVLVGNLSQLLITLVFGIINGFFWIQDNLKWNNGFYYFLGPVCFISSLVLVWIYFGLNRSQGLWTRIPFLKSSLSSLQVLSDFEDKDLRLSLIFSLLRYILFTHQYIFLLYGLLGYHNYLSCLHSMSLIFLVQSIIPSFVLTDIGIRGANSVFFLTFIFGKQNLISILATVFFVWLVNIILPAFVGLFFVLKVKSSLARP